jgi:hypothetical protein
VSVVRGRKNVQHASFSLGKAGFVTNITTLVWIVLAVVIFCMPTSITGLEATSMNYASAVFAGFAAISMVWYVVWGRKHFSGPPILKSEMAEGGVGVVRGHSIDEEASPKAKEVKQGTGEKVL